MENYELSSDCLYFLSEGNIPKQQFNPNENNTLIFSAGFYFNFLITNLIQMKTKH